MQAPTDSMYTDLSVTYNWKCSVCEEVSSETVMASNGGQILKPYRFPANGWKAIDVNGGIGLICPKHSIKIFVDGALLYER